MARPKLTVEMLEKSPPHSIILKGISIDSPKGLNMSNSGEKLAWVVVTGGINDWAMYTMKIIDISKYQSPSIIYTNLIDTERINDDVPEPYWEVVKNIGDKVHTKEFIQNVIDFDDEVWKKYRH